MTENKDKDVPCISLLADQFDTFDRFIGDCDDLAKDIMLKNPFKAESDGKRMALLVAIAREWHTDNAAGQGRREAPYPEPDGSAFDSEEPDDREERCDSCGETSRCLMNGLCPMCYELNGGTHD